MGRDEITSPYKPSLSVARGGVERSLRPSISSPVAGFLRIMAWANRSHLTHFTVLGQRNDPRQ